jgi:hypothetical protein
MAHLLHHSLEPAAAVVPNIMETAGLARLGMARGVENAMRDTTMQLHRLFMRSFL